MMKSTLNYIGFLIVLLYSFIGIAQENPLFEQGKEQYKAENYQEAIYNWQKILDSDTHSAAIYFNLGNAYYKLNSIGQSIYYYEKALQLAPNDKDIQNNLNFARNATIDAIESLPKTFFAIWDENLSKILSYNGWAWLTAISVLLAMVLFLSYYFTSYSLRKRVFFIATFVCLFLGILGITMSFRMFDKVQNTKIAIIFAEETEIKNSPKMSSETAFVLHEGTKVAIVEAEDNWYKIVLANGKDGWIIASDLKKL